MIVCDLYNVYPKDDMHNGIMLPHMLWVRSVGLCCLLCECVCVSLSQSEAYFLFFLLCFAYPETSEPIFHPYASSLSIRKALCTITTVTHVFLRTHRHSAIFNAIMFIYS